MKTESSGKISSFAKYAAGLVLAFCKCADVGWQKSSWEKNKFWVGRFSIIQFALENFNFCNLAGSIAYNVLGLCVRAGNRSTKADIITNIQLKNYC